MEFSKKEIFYKRTAEKIPNARKNITVLKSTPCYIEEFLGILCSYGDVSEKTAREFLDSFTKEFYETIVNCKKIILKFGTFVGCYEDRRKNLFIHEGFPPLKQTGIYSGVLYFRFSQALRAGYVHRLEEERMYFEGVKRGERRTCGETRAKLPRYPVFIPQKKRTVSRKQFILNLAMRSRITTDLSSRLLEALEFTIIELIRSNKYFVFYKTMIIGGYPRIASGRESSLAGYKGEDHIVKDYCPFCRVTSRYNKLLKGTWVGNDPNDLLVGEDI